MAYLTHDKGSRTSRKRVAGVYGLNMYTQTPEKAWRVMAATSLHNKRCKKPVYHLVVSWHKDDTPKLDDSVKQEQIQHILEGLELQEHQALVIHHNDTQHPHAHIMVNRVHPETYKAAQLSHDGYKRGRIARRLEKDYGLTVVPFLRNKIRIKSEIVF